MNEHLNDPGMDQVGQALGALREASAASRAPEHLEANLLQAFRAQHARPAAVKADRVRRFAWVAGAIAASLVVVAALRLSRPQVVNAPEAPVVAKAQEVPAGLKTPAVPPPVVATRTQPKSAAQPVRRSPRPRRAAPVVNASTPANRELTTDFFAIPYAPAMTQVDRGQLIRVNVPAASMRSFGLPVREDRMFDRVRADVLLGEDGIARAIRFVR